VTLRAALGSSLNVPAIETLERVGLPEVFEMALRLDIEGLGQPQR
jgi:membrane peptidoglycan carboxypeptidase